MVSDEMSGATPATEPVRIATGFAERSRRRKLAFLALLLLVLALLAYSVYYFQANRRLPIPQVVEPAKSAIQPPKYLYSITGTGRDALTKPLGLGVGGGNRLYVIDSGTRTIKVFDTGGAYLFSFAAIKDGSATALRNPVHLAVDASGSIWVTDRRLHGVYVFDSDGKFLRKFVPMNDAAFEWSPFGITVDTAGDVYVTDIPGVETHRVDVFDSTGKLKSKWGQAGEATDAKQDPGMFAYPNGIATAKDAKGAIEVYVADSNNRRVQVFAADGTFKRIIATEGTPRGIAINGDGQMFVVDVLSHRADIFSTTGQHLATFGENGFGPGQFQYPEDVALDAAGRIYISDRENNQVQVWGFPKAEIPGVTQIAPGKWGWCFAPLPLLLIPLLLRRRRFVATPDFVEAMVVAEAVPNMHNRRWRWIVAQSEHPAFLGRTVDGIDLGGLLEPEPWSHSEATALADKLGIALDRAGVLSMAKRAHTLCTEDPELARLAVLLDIDVYDHGSFVRRFVEGRRN